MIEKVTVFHDNKMIFQFLDGTEIEGWPYHKISFNSRRSSYILITAVTYFYIKIDIRLDSPPKAYKMKVKNHWTYEDKNDIIRLKFELRKQLFYWMCKQSCQLIKLQ
jgi:hypothetical protein